jgi:hypothetical protein
LVQLFWRWGLAYYLPRLAFNCYPPSLSLPSSDEPLAPGLCLILVHVLSLN